MQKIDFRRLVSKVDPRQRFATSAALSVQMRPTMAADYSASDEMQTALEAFVADYPAYAATGVLDALRTRDYARLDEQGHIYLDYAGGSLYPESLLREHMALLACNVYGNPHSKNLTSLAMTERIEQVRASVLRYFKADPDEYVAIITPNATGALKLIGEAFPFTPKSTYLLTFDNHNSVNGIREFARRRGATVTYIPSVRPAMRVDGYAVQQALARANPNAPNLFAYPAQSNFTGVQHSLDWITEAQSHGWEVLLDAAAFAPTNRLDLRRWQPDFVDISFYKMFGYPTGVGCLLARKTALQRLRRPWFAGGTVAFSSVLGDGHYLMPGAAGFEDGTVNYLNIPAIGFGLQLLESIGVEVIHKRVRCLTTWLIEHLLALQHSNGRPVIQLYGPANGESRGGIVQVNFLDCQGQMIDCTCVEQRANASHISLRAGCHCNPGARELALGLDKDDLANCFSDQDSVTYEEFLRGIAGQTTGALRASLGIVSNFADVYAYVRFARTFIDQTIATLATHQGF